MARLPRHTWSWPLLALALLLDARAEPNAAASTEPPPADPATKSVIEATPAEPAPVPEKPKRSRAISSDLASSLAQSMPKYNPPPKPPPEEETDEAVDLRDVDRPKNKIIRLPKYVVQEPKPAVFRERDIYSLKNRTGLAMQRYAGLNFGPFSKWNRPIALAMYQEQERLQNISDLKDTARTVSVDDKEAGTYIKRLTDETYMRSGSDADLGDAWSVVRSK
jgi:hypothetical protein